MFECHDEVRPRSTGKDVRKWKSRILRGQDSLQLLLMILPAGWCRKNTTGSQRISRKKGQFDVWWFPPIVEVVNQLNTSATVQVLSPFVVSSMATLLQEVRDANRVIPIELTERTALSTGAL